MNKPPDPPAGATPPPTRPGKAVPLPVTINGEAFSHDGDPAMPLLWFLRDRLRLTGTKYGCGIGVCGACTVLVDGKVTRACLTPMSAVATHAVTTIEGLEGDALLSEVGDDLVKRIIAAKMAKMKAPQAPKPPAPPPAKDVDPAPKKPKTYTSPHQFLKKNLFGI